MLLIRLHPVERKTVVVRDIHFACHNGNGKAVTVSDPYDLFLLREAFDIVNGDATADVAFIVSLPVFHEVANIFDIDTRAWDLPQSGMRRLAAGARLALVTCLLQKLTSEAGSKLSNLTGLLSLFW